MYQISDAGKTPVQIISAQALSAGIEVDMRNFMQRFTQSIQRFMYGRYGVDQLNTTLLYTTLGLSIIGMFWNNLIIYWVSYFTMFGMMFRALSKNHAKRYRENEKFLKATKPVLRMFAKTKHQLQDKNNRYYSCPQCHQTIRVPKGKGKIAITCPKCRKEFIKRT